MDKKEIFKVYEYNKYGIFSKSIILDETDKSPSGAWNIPGGCTDVTPPEETEGFVPVWDGEKWDSVEDHRNETYWLPEEPYGSPGHVMETVGALPEGATTTPPEQTPEELAAEAVQNEVNTASAALSAASAKFLPALLSGGDVAAITAEYQAVLAGLSDAAAVQLADKFQAWSASTTYTAGARVQYGGELYKAIADVQSATAPDADTEHWSKL